MYVYLLLGLIGSDFKSTVKIRNKEKENQALQAMVWLVHFDKVYSGLQSIN